MMLAFNRMKEIGGGIVMAENGKIVYELPLPLNGVMSEKPVEELMSEEKELMKYMKERGYKFNDPFIPCYFYQRPIYHIFESHSGDYMM